MKILCYNVNVPVVGAEPATSEACLLEVELSSKYELRLEINSTQLLAGSFVPLAPSCLFAKKMGKMA